MSVIFQRVMAFLMTVLAFFGINVGNADIHDTVVRGDGYVYTIDREDREIEFCFPANASTGYQWVYSMEGDALLFLKTEYDDNDDFPWLAGRSGEQEFEFRAVKAGDVTVTFSYVRQWEDGEAAREITAEITVGSDFEITVREVTEAV